ncbi:MAG: DNA translocase FtsK [Candidatus Cloacimonadaceae bacterium]|nr:DNA translocase FtsK [Candidatus Cloacimonadaceae bacterium]
MPKAKLKTPKRRKRSTTIWQGRLAWGIVAILAMLLCFSLIRGPLSIQRDIELLNGDLWGWITSGESIENPIGRFGVLISYPLLWIFGYFFSLAAAIITLVFSVLYFIDPSAERLKTKGYLFVINLFLLQIILSSLNGSTPIGVFPTLIFKALAMVFRPLGAGIILWGSMILITIAIIEAERIKAWLALAWENYQRRLEEKGKPDKSSPKLKPTIDAPNMHVNTPEPAKELTPSINDHAKLNPTPVQMDIDDIITKPEPPKNTARHTDKEDAAEDDREYLLPSIPDFLESPVKLSEKERKEIEGQIMLTSKILMDKLAEFGIEAEVINVNIGPIITQYELKPAPGVKVSRFPALADDLALAIKAKSIRVQAPIPGRGLIGIEIPNFARDMIYLRDILLSDEMRASSSKLAFGLGKDISGKPVITDLTKMPHLLIAGATGSGKSVCINTIIMSLILRTKPDDLRLVLIDPKKVELAGYNDLPHLINQVVTDPDGALETMYWAVKEMEKRYELLQDEKVRDISGYNEKARELKGYEPLPYIVIIIDEFADLIMTSGKDIELPITRLAQMARAVGIHLILATQRPSIKVITGIIKANFPARIAFQVSSRVDSRVILDMIGAERLLGQGDMLFIPPGKPLPERIHGAFVSDHEIARTCDYLRMQPKPKQEFTIAVASDGEFNVFDYDDDLFPEAAKVVVRSNTASVSMLQRHFKIGYARAGRLVDLLEKSHIVGPHLGSKSRDVLATLADLKNMGIANEED